MSNLVPEQRPDKNGKITTRWVKPGKSTAATAGLSAVGVPALDPGSRAEREQRLQSVKDRLSPYNANFDLYSMPEALSSLSDDTLASITNELAKEDSEDRIQITAFWIDTYAQRNQRLLREVLHYWDAVDPYTDYNFVDDAISHLHELKSLPPLEDYSKADQELELAIRNILSTTESLFAGDGDTIDFDEDNPHILPEPLCQLVMRRPEDFDQINDIILDHGISDAEQIEMMLDSDTQSLRDGIL